MTPSEFEAFLTEMEPDIRAAERDLREIAAMEDKGVTAAGRLSEHRALQPRLDALLKAQEEDAETASRLERRIAGLMDRYATRVSISLALGWREGLITCIRLTPYPNCSSRGTKICVDQKTSL